MKTLLLIRHAKSSWSEARQPDFERTLTDSGKSDARLMALRVKEKSLKITLFVSSPAKRARKTAKIFMEEFGERKENLLTIPSLYQASVKDFYRVVENLAPKEETAAIFAHNPGITDFINSLECSPVYNMPTCAVFALKIKTTDWKEMEVADKEFLFFDYPKSRD